MIIYNLRYIFKVLTNFQYFKVSRVKDYWTLEDTLTGYLNNELLACSKHGCTTLLDVCPETCVLRPNNSFWNAASKEFAQSAEGVVSVMLNGTIVTGAFCNESSFATRDLANLNPEKVTILRVLLVHMPGQTVVETCNSPGSLLTLKSLVEAKGIAYECADDPDDIQFLLCFENTDNKGCMHVEYALRTITKS